MPIKNNQRNYYRILQVQPDASLEVIKSNYRTLLQKLRLHPDLGGKDWNATLINVAYATLRDSEKRAIYDRQLLRKHTISTLSGDQLKVTPDPDLDNSSAHGRNINKRNYYRILNIQPDAATAIIKTSYQTLLNKTKIPAELLHEAYRILGDPEKRAAYDRLRAKYIHTVSLEKSKSNAAAKQSTKHAENAVSIYMAQELQTIKAVNYAQKEIASYQSLSNKYCIFCQTPYFDDTSQYNLACCIQCDSPLLSPPESLASQTRRDVSRITQNSPLNFYTDWPGQEIVARLDDLSPTGMRMLVPLSVYRYSISILNNGTIIKITGQNFKAVGDITYHRRELNWVVYGVRFLTIAFYKQKGQFLNLTA